MTNKAKTSKNPKKPEVETVVYAEDIEPGTEIPLNVVEQSQELAAASTNKMIQSVPVVAESPYDKFIMVAMEKDNMDQLEKMLELKQKYDDELARKDFTAAMAMFKAEDITIEKDRTVRFANNDGSETLYMHASLGNIVKIAVPKLAMHGLSHRWVISNELNQPVRVACILTHKNGHSEEVSLQGPPDESGKKNTIQKGASTVTYLERYTFLAVTGLAVEEQDDDGNLAGTDLAPPVELISEEQALQLHSKASDNDLLKVFMDWLTSAFTGVAKVEDIPADCFDNVMKKLNASIKAKNKAAESE